MQIWALTVILLLNRLYDQCIISFNDTFLHFQQHTTGNNSEYWFTFSATPETNIPKPRQKIWFHFSRCLPEKAKHEINIEKNIKVTKKNVETTVKEKERQQQKIPLNKTGKSKSNFHYEIWFFSFLCSCVWLFSNFLLESVKTPTKC